MLLIKLEEYNQVELLADLELPLAKILSEMEEILNNKTKKNQHMNIMCW